MSSVVISGDTSGAITLAAPAIAGTNTLSLPAQTATIATLTTPSFATTIGVGGATAAASGAGITFPASQSASSDANTLDDYEEGTWSPTVGGNSTYSFQQGHYVKIGQLVFIFADMEINLIGTGNTSSITNAPFTSFDSSTPTGYPINVSYFNALANNITWLTAYIADNATTISFAGNTTAATAIQNNGFAVFGNSTRIVLSGCYRTSA